MAEVILLPIINSIAAGLITGIINRFIIKSECCATQNNGVIETVQVDDQAELITISSCSSEITNSIIDTSD